MSMQKHPQSGPQKPQPVPEWKVYFQGGTRSWEREQAGQEVRCDHALPWPGWSIPAVYLCWKGLCVLVARQVPKEQERAFLQQVEAIQKEYGDQFDRAKRLELGKQNPYRMDLEITAQVNGKTLKSSGGMGLSWNPDPDEEPSQRGESLMRHFGLDRSSGWSFMLMRFPWATKKKPVWHGCTLRLVRRAATVAGPKFVCQQVGQTMSFVHPQDGKEHQLTVMDWQQETIDPAVFGDPGMDYPTHMQVIQYTVEPPLPQDSLWLEDCCQGDAPRKKVQVSARDPIADRYGLQEPGGEASVGVIGGAVAVVTAVGRGEVPVANSSLYFSPVEQVRWLILMKEPQEAPALVEIP